MFQTVTITSWSAPESRQRALHIRLITYQNCISHHTPPWTDYTRHHSYTCTVLIVHTPALHLHTHKSHFHTLAYFSAKYRFALVSISEGVILFLVYLVLILDCFLICTIVICLAWLFCRIAPAVWTSLPCSVCPVWPCLYDLPY